MSKKKNIRGMFLDRYFCKEDCVGNRPCDNGVLCDRCQPEWVDQEYEHFKEYMSHRHPVIRIK